MFSGKSELTGVDSSIGTRAAKVFVSNALIPIQTSLDTSFLNRNDPRLVGSHSFIEMWQDNTRRLFSGRLLNSQLRGGDNTKNIKRVIEDIRQTIIDTIKHQDGDSHEKFVHGDYAPTNLAFHKRRLYNVPDVTVLDFEHAGATRNSALALITDMSDFYRSCGTNNTLRMKFMYGLADAWRESGWEHSPSLLFASMVFGTLQHCGSRMRNRMVQSHREHAEAISLVSTLVDNVRRLDLYIKDHMNGRRG